MHLIPGPGGQRPKILTLAPGKDLHVHHNIAAELVQGRRCRETIRTCFVFFSVGNH